jgi:cytochrome bd-type quinol oxidase subunit 1
MSGLSVAAAFVPADQHYLYLTLARRWTRVMVTLFAVGVITGTVLSIEMGLLWPNFTGTFVSVFGHGTALGNAAATRRRDGQ